MDAHVIRPHHSVLSHAAALRPYGSRRYCVAPRASIVCSAGGAVALEASESVAEMWGTMIIQVISLSPYYKEFMI